MGFRVKDCAVAFIAAFLLAGCSQQNAQEWRQFSKSAESSISRKDFASAATDLGKALDCMGNDASISKDRIGLLTKLAYCYAQKGDITAAESNYNRAVELAESTYGKDSIETWGPLEGLRSMWAQQKQPLKSEPAARKLLAVCDKNLKENDPRVEYALSNVIGAACQNGVCKDETGLIGRLLELRTKRFGASAVQTCAARQMAAEGYGHHHQYEEAAALYKENADLLQRNFPQRAVAARVLYAAALHGGGKDAEAYKEMKDIIAIESKNPRQYRESYINALSNMGEICAALGKTAEAQQSYEMMCAAAEEFYGKDNVLTADFLVHYAEFLKKSGKAPQAAALDKRIAAIYKH